MERRGNFCTIGHRRALVVVLASVIWLAMIGRLGPVRTAVEYNAPAEAGIYRDGPARTEAGFNGQVAATIVPDDPGRMAAE